MKMELWFTEQQTDNLRWSARVTRTLHSEKSQYQDILVVETPQLGRLLALDGFVQTTDIDEFVYHEMLAHVPLFTHPDPRRVLIIGGGDGGIVREAVKHPGVREFHLVEIDGQVIEICRKFFPNISCELDNPRVKVHVEDGIEFVKNVKDPYDVVIIDSSEPIGPGIGLFTQEFYGSVSKALAPDGLMVAQTESPFYNQDVIKMAWSGISATFPIARLYQAAVPTYPSGLWSLTMGSKKYNPLEVRSDRFQGISTKYYTPDVHRAAFSLPRFVEELLR